MSTFPLGWIQRGVGSLNNIVVPHGYGACHTVSNNTTHGEHCELAGGQGDIDRDRSRSTYSVREILVATHCPLFKQYSLQC